MKAKLFAPTLLSLAAIVLSGCSSIERASDLQNHSLSKRTSRKTDVVNAIGLPIKTEKDASKGLEFWFYTGKPISSSFFIPLPVAAIPAGANLTQVFYSNLGAKNISSNQQIALICVFEQDGRLVDIYNPNSRQE
jgi:hypothetical protein